MIRLPPRSTPLYSSAASDVYKRQVVPTESAPPRQPRSFTRGLICVVELMTVLVVMESVSGYDGGPAGASGSRFSEGPWSVGRADASRSAGCRYRGDFGERGHDCCGPWPGRWDPQPPASPAGGQFGGDMQESVAQCFGFGLG